MSAWTVRCAQCRSLFIAYHPSGRYCSVRCRVAAFRARRAQLMMTK